MKNIKHDNLDEDNSSQIEETVIVLHGTYATDGEWWRNGSEFCRKLDKVLEKLGSNARCWAGEECENFLWSGANSEANRIIAADEIGRHLLISDAKNVHMVAHSHGGNIPLKALDNCDGENIRTVVCLGSPIFKYRSKSMNFSIPNFLIKTFIYMQCSIFYYSSSLFYICICNN